MKRKKNKTDKPCVNLEVSHIFPSFSSIPKTQRRLKQEFANFVDFGFFFAFSSFELNLASYSMSILIDRQMLDVNVYMVCNHITTIKHNQSSKKNKNKTFLACYRKTLKISCRIRRIMIWSKKNYKT